MKYSLIAGLFVSQIALADNCKVTSASVERDGKFQKESITVCKEGVLEFPKLKIGDTILENEVGLSNVDAGYFKHNNAICRLFTDRVTQKGRLRVYHGVICQVDNSDTNWLIVDRW